MTDASTGRELVQNHDTSGTFEACSKALRSLLTTGDEPKASIAEIARSPALRREAVDLIPVLETITHPASPDEITVLMAKNAPTYGLGDKSPQEWSTIFAVYREALAGVPVDAIRDAFLRWNRAEMYPNEPGRHAFFPKPAELFKLSQPRRAELYKALGRAREAAKWTEPTPGQTPDERAKVAAMMEELRASMSAKKPAGALPPPGQSRAEVAATLRTMADRERALAKSTHNFSRSQGAVDNGGITPLIREKLGLGPAPAAPRVVEPEVEEAI